METNVNANANANIATHNGILTVRSVRTGDHRTFKIHTQAADAKFAPGKRVISLLTGPDNQNDYTGFGFVEASGDFTRIHVWAKKRGAEGAPPSMFEILARFLENLGAAVKAGNAEVNLEGRCRVCDRPLTTPESVERGIGPVCEGRGI